jgi:hypothetical protein
MLSKVALGLLYLLIKKKKKPVWCSCGIAVNLLSKWGAADLFQNVNDG